MRAAPGGQGFILVGVVMFVLALTILGLSLFTLSSYEAQSLTQSHARQQGGYDAQSGIEMVKALIMAPPNMSLATASAAVGSYHVTSAVAMQHRSNGTWDSTGVVAPDSTVLIRVTSVNYGERRTLEARFRPSTSHDYYKRLFTVARSVFVENVESQPPPLPPIVHPATQLFLTGQGWQTVVNAPVDTAWANNQVTWVNPQPHFESTEAFTVPDIPGYIASHPTAYVPSRDASNPNLVKLNFDSHPAGTPVAYYRSPANPAGPGSPFNYEEPARVDVTVQGTVVWVLPRGVQFHQQVNIQRKLGPPAVLIIVAGPNGGVTDPTGAIHFQGGVNVNGGNDVYVILATDSKAIIEFANENNTYDCRLDRLSILCRDLHLQGPRDGIPNRTLRLAHDPAMDAIIQSLYADPSSPLPRPAGTANSLTFVPGSWRSATP